MPNSKISFNQKSNGAALVCQEQEQVLPLVGELKGAELDFVAGDDASLRSPHNRQRIPQYQGIILP